MRKNRRYIGIRPFGVIMAIALPLLTFAQEPVTVPAGTAIEVVLLDPLDSSRSGAGEVTRASVGEPVVLGDVVAITKGSDAAIELVKAQDGKSWFVKLRSVKVKGKDYPVVASYAEVKAKKTGSKTAKRAVGLGALGAGIGAIAGGGTGAAIGAGVGAGVGAVSGSKTGVEKVELPAESVLAFELREALVLK
jgi:hypothetical protein